MEKPTAPTTKLIIERFDPMITLAGGRPLALPKLGLARSQTGQSFESHTLKNLSRTVSLEVLLRGGRGLQELDVPENLLNKIAEFLRKDTDEKQDFDCTRFIHFLFDVPYRFAISDPHTAPLTDDWTLLPLTHDTTLTSGDAVVLLDNLEVKHMALYLGERHFLSQSGFGGQLIVATLEDMHQIYQTDKASRAVPK